MLGTNDTTVNSKPAFSLARKRVYVAGHRGMVGSAIVRRLEGENCEVQTADRGELDLRDLAQTRQWMAAHRPQVVFMAAAKVGGILANNTFRADFIYDNLAIATNAIHAAHEAGVEKLVFLGSTCIYPRLADQPMREEALLTGPLESTNEPYAIAKIAGIKLAEAYRDQYGADFISVMPTNLYGPGDNYHPDHSHVVAALIRRFHEAKAHCASEVVVWGTGKPRREFLYTDDLADACVFLAKNYSEREIINVGCGHDVTIAELSRQIASVVGFEGRIVQDASRPDGTPRKLVDISKLSRLGWSPRISMQEGLPLAYRDYLERLGQRSPGEPSVAV